jgi:hypothetical protein
MNWTSESILGRIRTLHANGVDLSYRAVTATDRALLSAAVYHFGSFRKAVEAAGVPYVSNRSKPGWTRESIIELVQKAHKEGTDLSWSAVMSREDDLRRAAFASLQKRLFGSWNAALIAADIDPNATRAYRAWTRETIAQALRKRHQAGMPMSSAALQAEEPALHAAAFRYFGSFDAALQAAKLKPETVRLRRKWTPDTIRAEVKRLTRKSELDPAALRRRDPALYLAVLRIFGSVEEVLKGK